MNENQIWKPIPNLTGYYASSEGEIKGKRELGRNLTKAPNSKGYYRVNIMDNGRKRCLFVHKLVALAFKGDPSDEAMQVDHINGIKTDNRPENLEWVTCAENIRRARDMGIVIKNQGVLAHNAVLTEKMVQEARSARDMGISIESIANRSGVQPQTLRKAANRKTWKHIP